MKKFLVLAGLATALFATVPMTAQADNYRHDDRRIYRDHGKRDWGRGSYDRRHDYRHMKRRDFGYWRPRLERARYHHFGRPIFYDHYYRVPCRDYRGRLVMLTVNAYTGAIISVGF